MSKSVLLIDDTPNNLKLLSELLSKNGFKVSTAKNGTVALRFLEKIIPDIILLDIKMPEMGGFEVCQRIKANKHTQHIPVIFISALDDLDEKTNAFKIGGVDYVTKPFHIEEVLARVNTHILIQDTQKRLKGEISIRTRTEQELQKAYNDVEVKVRERTAELEELKKQLEEENVYLQEEIKTTYNFENIIGRNKNLKNILKQIEQVARSETTVLILGETGTGKELIARALHDLSDLRNHPLVKVNCAALPAGLIESELFGHEKGAFTGAVSQKIGRFELADKGTIFLDEIGDLPLDLQAKLLRVLQEGEFERLGSSKTQKVKVRVLAATNRNLDEQRSNGKFRDDLFFRLNVFPVECPPLRERTDDIPMLVKHFVEKFNKKIGKQITKTPKKTMDTLQLYPWPGNVRELENIIERAVILSPGNQLQLGDWLTKISGPYGKSSIPTLDELQKEHIIHVLELTDHKVAGESGAAKILGLNRTTLLARMKKWGIKIGRKTVNI